MQAAKQRIIQRVREGERSRIREEFADRVGELLSGEVQQIERGKIVVMLNKFREAEAIIPYREQNHREHFHQDDTIRAVLKRLEETPKGPRLILTRGDPLFVKALFKLEVPEIQQGIVDIRATAREVGSRTKIAVFSRDDGIDPVGACVGLKGSRVQAVVNELGGERIDIVPWSSDPERFAKLALAPARVARVFSDPDTKTVQAIVDEDQLQPRHRPQRAERAARLGADRLEDRPLLEPRVAGAGRRRAAVRAAAAAADGGGRGRRGRAAGRAGRAHAGPAGGARRGGLPHLLGHPRPRPDEIGGIPGMAPEMTERLVTLIDELSTTDEDEARRRRPRQGGAPAPAEPAPPRRCRARRRRSRRRVSDRTRAALGLLGLGRAGAAPRDRRGGRAGGVAPRGGGGARAAGGRQRAGPRAAGAAGGTPGGAGADRADAEALGQALGGRPPVHGVAVLDRQLARGLRAYLEAEDRGEKVGI